MFAEERFLSKHDPRESSKGFWDTFKPFFSNKVNIAGERVQLIENGSILSNNLDIAETFNEHYHTVTDRLNVPRWNSVNGEGSNSVHSAIEHFSNHPSVVKIAEKWQSDEQFEFSPVTESQMLKVIKQLNESKSVSGGIPTKIIKLAKYVCAPTLTLCFNHSLESNGFPDCLKMADIIHVHKKNSKHDKDNYRPVSLLPCSSKIFEKVIANQLNPFLESIFSKSLSSSGKIGAILMDLSKAFDCSPHDLLIAKFAAYGFGQRSLKLLHNYLNARKHRVRMGSSFSDFLSSFTR